MMKYVPALFFFLLLACASTARAQHVSVDFDRGGDFSRFKTYSWVEGVSAKNPIIDHKVRESIDENLAAKGLRRVEEGGDMSVMYLAAVDMDLHFAAANWHTTGNWLSQTESGISLRSQTWDVQEGTLVVCLSDASSKDLMWRGTTRIPLDKKRRSSTDAPNIIEAVAEDARKVEKKVSKSLGKMFKQYPSAKPGR
jgi:hypothetical protein